MSWIIYQYPQKSAQKSTTCKLKHVFHRLCDVDMPHASSACCDASIDANDTGWCEATELLKYLQGILPLARFFAGLNPSAVLPYTSIVSAWWLFHCLNLISPFPPSFFKASFWHQGIAKDHICQHRCQVHFGEQRQGRSPFATCTTTADCSTEGNHVSGQIAAPDTPSCKHWYHPRPVLMIVGSHKLV